MQESQSNPLTISSIQGHHEVVAVLLEAGTNINYKDKVHAYIGSQNFIASLMLSLMMVLVIITYHNM